MPSTAPHSYLTRGPPKSLLHVKAVASKNTHALPFFLSSKCDLLSAAQAYLYTVAHQKSEWLH